MIHKFDTIIIGAGAAGLMCAYHLGARDKKVALLDHSHKLAEKIRISGGGRCNFTNLYTEPKCYISNNPPFCISPLSRYTPWHFCELLDKHSITYHEKTLGQLFCDDKSQGIIDLLDFLCSSNNVQRQMGVTINNIEKLPDGFRLNTSQGIYQAETLVIATGGLSLPQIGATGFGYNLAKQFDLTVIPPKPALVPLTLEPQDLDYFTELSGTSFYSQTSVCHSEHTATLKPGIPAPDFWENSLLTHRGLSGPAILQISSYWNPGDSIQINMLPKTDLAELLKEYKESNKLLANFLHQFFSERLAGNLCKMMQINKPLSQLSNKEITQISNFIHKLSLKPSGTLGYKKAEVTKGGVDTKMLSSKTMAANNVEGLYFIGEVVDVTGWLGGYNFQWAWASAYATAYSI